MRIVLSPKDTTDKILMENVAFTWQEGELICIRFEDGRERSYPMQHIWYIEKYRGVSR